MPMLTGGNIIQGGNVITGSKTRITWCNTTPTDANVGGGYRTPANGELACDCSNGNLYERQVAVWTRIDIT